VPRTAFKAVGGARDKLLGGPQAGILAGRAERLATATGGEVVEAVARVGRALVDPRTLTDEEAEPAARRVQAALVE
jgi:seryl-tRNA(Sec) selenium transferase